MGDPGDVTQHIAEECFGCLAQKCTAAVVRIGRGEHWGAILWLGVREWDEGDQGWV